MLFRLYQKATQYLSESVNLGFDLLSIAVVGPIVCRTRRRISGKTKIPRKFTDKGNSLLSDRTQRCRSYTVYFQ